MKKFEEITLEDYQSFLKNKFNDNFVYINSSNSIKNEITYKINDKIGTLSFSDPDFILWLYEKEYDITSPLKNLILDYIEIDEFNSVLFEYAMEVNRLINKTNNSDNFKIKEMKKIQKELAYKI